MIDTHRRCTEFVIEISNAERSYWSENTISAVSRWVSLFASIVPSMRNGFPLHVMSALNVASLLQRRPQVSKA